MDRMWRSESVGRLTALPERPSVVSAYIMQWEDPTQKALRKKRLWIQPQNCVIQLHLAQRCEDFKAWKLKFTHLFFSRWNWMSMYNVYSPTMCLHVSRGRWWNCGIDNNVQLRKLPCWLLNSTMSASITLGNKDYCVVQCRDVGTLETRLQPMPCLRWCIPYRCIIGRLPHFCVTTLKFLPWHTWCLRDQTLEVTTQITLRTDSGLVEYVDSDVSDE